MLATSEAPLQLFGVHNTIAYWMMWTLRDIIEIFDNEKV